MKSVLRKILAQTGLPDDLGIAHPVYVVEQIVAKIVHAAPLQLSGEQGLHFSSWVKAKVGGLEASTKRSRGGASPGTSVPPSRWPCCGRPSWCQNR